MLQGHFQIVITVLAFALVVAMAALLKSRGVLKKEDAAIFAKLLTHAVLPVVIFAQLLQNPPNPRHLLSVLAMVLAGCVNLVAAWWIAKLLGFTRPMTGALMIVSAFGSSSLLGYPMVQFAFPNDPEAMTDAILISELAVGLPIFTLCPIVAMQFGQCDEEKPRLKDTLLQYFRSPVLLAVAGGLVAGLMRPPLDGPLAVPVLKTFQMVSGALAALACVILGLQMQFRRMKGLLPMICISALLQMFLLPLVAWGLGLLFGLSPLERRILVLLASMPSAVLGPVFAARYKCEGEMASTTTFANIVLSLVCIPLAFWLLGR
jgi:malate permease and related proteins